MAKKSTDATNQPEKKPARKSSTAKATAGKAAASDKKNAKAESKGSSAKSAKSSVSGTSSRKRKQPASDAGSVAAITALASQDADNKNQVVANSPKAKAAPRRKSSSADKAKSENQNSTGQNKPSNAEDQKPASHEAPAAADSHQHVGENHEIPVQSFPTDNSFGDPNPQGKRNKRRRNKQRNNNGQNDRGHNERGQQSNNHQDSGSRDINQKKLCKKAWEIFSSEVAEEGLALMDDSTSRDAARRAFRVAELFLIEQSRHKQVHKQKDQQSGGNPEGKQEKA